MFLFATTRLLARRLGADVSQLSLNLEPSWTVKKLSQIPTAATYNLTVANLLCSKFTLGVELFRPLFISSRATLRQLAITINPRTIPVWATLLPLVSGRITNLAVVVDMFEPARAFLPLLSTFTSLDTLRLLYEGPWSNWHLKDLLRSLPNVKRLQIVEANQDLTSADLLEALAEASALDTLEMMGGIWSPLQAVREECTRRSIALVLQDAGMV